MERNCVKKTREVSLSARASSYKEEAELPHRQALPRSLSARSVAFGAETTARPNRIVSNPSNPMIRLISLISIDRLTIAYMAHQSSSTSSLISNYRYSGRPVLCILLLEHILYVVCTRYWGKVLRCIMWRPGGCKSSVQSTNQQYLAAA